MNKVLVEYIDNLEDEVSDIPSERKKKLKSISDFLRLQLKSEDGAKLNFICTHNSRRSHLCQVWAATLAHYFGLENIHIFSGGTEETAFNPRAVAALERAGFKIENPGGDNPHYRVYFDDKQKPLVCFSKTFDDSVNPQKEFAAIMTCSDADQNCPIVPGASARFSIPYVDPKESDGTSREAETYDERCLQIAAEMYYLMSQV